MCFSFRGPTGTDDANLDTDICVGDDQDAAAGGYAECEEALLERGMVWVGVGQGERVVKDRDSLLKADAVLPKVWGRPPRIPPVHDVSSADGRASLTVASAVSAASPLHAGLGLRRRRLKYDRCLKGRGNSGGREICDVRVDGRGLEMSVPQQGLNAPKVAAALKEMRSEGMA